MCTQRCPRNPPRTVFQMQFSSIADSQTATPGSRPSSLPQSRRHCGFIKHSKTQRKFKYKISAYRPFGSENFVISKRAELAYIYMEGPEYK